MKITDILMYVKIEDLLNLKIRVSIYSLEIITNK